MLSAEGSILITFNGEIYNHSEIRSELSEKNNFKKWNGSSDTETLLQAIEIWGLEKTLEKLMECFHLRHGIEKKMSLFG